MDGIHFSVGDWASDLPRSQLTDWWREEQQRLSLVSSNLGKRAGSLVDHSTGG